MDGGTTALERRHASTPHQLLLIAALLLGATLAARAAAPLADGAQSVGLDLAAQTLAESLKQFAGQARLQILYEQSLVDNRPGGVLHGEWRVDRALDRLLNGTGLRWRFIDTGTVAIYAPGLEQAGVVARQGAAAGAASSAGSSESISQLADVEVLGDRPWSLASETGASGFGKSVLDTPRAVSFVGGEAIDAFSLTAVEDLLRLVPGVFTTTRFGVQGSVDVRGVPGDTYLRGMRRVTLQGHGRSVFAAMDSIEVVPGAAAPLYGLGKFGGYTNVVPKSGRAGTGRFLAAPEGFLQLIGGQYRRQEASFGVGGPLSSSLTGGRQGGYYVYGLAEDSDSYADGVPVRQQVLQAASSVADVLGHFRLETGANYQLSRTSGALVGRLTRDLVDNGRYIAGSPLVNLDLNGNGRIGYLEMQAASPVRGSLSASNQPLNQVFAWPRDGAGRPLPLGQFPTVAGIPATMYAWLLAHPESDPGGLLRAQGIGGPLPTSGAVPVGMVLDPRTVHYAQFNPHRSAAYERELEARFLTAYIDLVNDGDPDATVKNQLFFDRMNQFKSSNQPFSQVQVVHVLEDKLTVTRRLRDLPGGLAVNSLFTANARYTVSEGRMTLADYGNHRGDASAADWSAATGGMTPNTFFTSSNDVSTLADDGLPWASLYSTRELELGIGALFDVDLPAGVNLLAGARYDLSRASNTDFAGRFNTNTGSAANPGAVLAQDDRADGSDGGPSWSVSLAKTLRGGLRPYVTLARSSILLDGNNNSLTNAVIRLGQVGSAALREAGVKGMWLDGAFSVTGAVYQQGRVDADAGDDPNLLSAYATSTTSRGWQVELRVAPSHRSLLGLYTLHQVTRYDPNVGATVQVDARALGFRDVVDAGGRVVYPAEAFLYGGRARVVLPDGMEQYSRKQGIPEVQMGLFASHEMRGGWGLSLRGNYLSSTCSGRLCLVRLPASLVFDAGLFGKVAGMEVKLDVFNFTDRRYFRARTGDTLGDVIAQAMPGRRWQATLRHRF